MTSSLGAWGVGDEKNFTPIRPTDTPHPNTRYGKSKLKAERHLESLEGFPYVVMRPTGVYGPYERDYYLMMKSIKYGFDFIVGFKPQLITFIYVKDLVQAIFKAIDRGVVRRGYFLSEGKAYTSSQFRRYVATLWESAGLSLSKFRCGYFGSYRSLPKKELSCWEKPAH